MTGDGTMVGGEFVDALMHPCDWKINGVWCKAGALRFTQMDEVRRLNNITAQPSIATWEWWDSNPLSSVRNAKT